MCLGVVEKAVAVMPPPSRVRAACHNQVAEQEGLDTSTHDPSRSLTMWCWRLGVRLNGNERRPSMPVEVKAGKYSFPLISLPCRGSPASLPWRWFRPLWRRTTTLARPTRTPPHVRPTRSRVEAVRGARAPKAPPPASPPAPCRPMHSTACDGYLILNYCTWYCIQYSTVQYCMIHFRITPIVFKDL